MAIVQDGKDIDIAINVRYVIDALRAMETEEINVNFIDNIRPVLIKQKDDDRYIQIIMPVKIKEG